MWCAAVHGAAVSTIQTGRRAKVIGWPEVAVNRGAAVGIMAGPADAVGLAVAQHDAGP
jgi:hypothetical protein